MSDPVHQIRGKARFIVEVRYPIVPIVLDRLGQLIESVHPKIEKRFPHWQADPGAGAILFTDDVERSVQQFYISPKKMSFILEDCSTAQEFFDAARQHLALAYDALGTDIRSIRRCGVRMIEVINAGSNSNRDATHHLLLQKLHVVPPELELPYIDSLVKLVHPQGSYQVGPTHPGDAWIGTVFMRPDQNVPENGIALDIDSYQTDIPIENSGDFARAFTPMWRLSKSIEEGILRHLGVIRDGQA